MMLCFEAKLDDNVEKINASTDEKIAALKQDIKEDFLTKINANEAAISDHNQRIKHLEADIETLKDALEKSAKAYDFTIKGIPILPNVHPRPLYLKIASAIGYCLETTPPADAFRLGKTKVGAKFDPLHDSLSEPRASCKDTISKFESCWCSGKSIGHWPNDILTRLTELLLFL
jgi:hypothetical protein